MPAEDEAKTSATFEVSPAHPALPGHFPGNPVVPGVWILDEALQAAERALGRPVRVHGVPQAKFLSPLLPGVVATVELVPRGDGLLFEVRTSSAVIARGSFRLEPASLP
jgi:3-hydroxymyristoyl/3-hydroxydecanoyl-(acyl carrier protein) dehydratase